MPTIRSFTSGRSCLRLPAQLGFPSRVGTCWRKGREPRQQRHVAAGPTAPAARRPRTAAPAPAPAAAAARACAAQPRAPPTSSIRSLRTSKAPRSRRRAAATASAARTPRRAAAGKRCRTPHTHDYAPFDLRLFAFREGCYYFVGDPRDFGYTGQTYSYYGAHPIHDHYGGGWCFMVGGHYHWWRPWSPYFTVVGPWYYWYGPYSTLLLVVLALLLVLLPVLLPVVLRGRALLQRLSRGARDHAGSPDWLAGTPRRRGGYAWRARRWLAWQRAPRLAGSSRRRACGGCARRAWRLALRLTARAHGGYQGAPATGGGWRGGGTPGGGAPAWQGGGAARRRLPRRRTERRRLARRRTVGRRLAWRHARWRRLPRAGGGGFGGGFRGGGSSGGGFRGGGGGGWRR